jgi:predicted metal-dependent peptidase
MNELNDSLAKTCKDLMLVEPFYGFFLMMLQKKFDDKCQTAGVSLHGINYKLRVGPEFWKGLTPDHRRGLLKHELLHIGFFHLTDYESFTDHDIANIAMDLEINQYINESDLPPGGQVLSLYPELNLDEKEGTHSYYEKLMQAKNSGSCPNLNEQLKAMADGKGTCICIGEDGTESEVNLPNHSSWGEGDKPDEATQKLIHNQTKHILNELAEQVTKSRGTIPGEFISILEKINAIEEPKFDWKGYLRRFTGGSVKVYTKKLRRKYNKRYEENPGLKIKPKKHILVALDTSGSVNNSELLEFMQEVHHIYKTGADVTVVQADAAIRHIGPYDPKKPYEIHGRGGTSFDPVVDYYNANKNKYTCLVYLTDGEAPAPETVLGRVLWALSKQSHMTDHLPGHTIQLN